MCKAFNAEGEQLMLMDCAAEPCLDIACKYSGIVDETIQRCGDHSLADYLRRLTPHFPPSFQGRDDLADVIYRYAAPLLGEPAARTASQDLLECPLVLTANHHGVDFFAQSVQGSLLFSLYKTSETGVRATVPIFSCGAVPLDNTTYPLGLLLYHVNEAHLDSIPKKFPVFSNRFRRSMVSVASRLDEAMIQRAQSRLDKMVQENEISPKLAEPLHIIFREDYASPDVLALSNYSEQSVLLNQKIWNRLFSDATTAPDLVYLEMEKITHMLLESDLSDPESLAFRVMFDPDLRNKVLRELDGAKACWNLKKLEQRVRMHQLGSSGRNRPNGCGTLFFWGVNKRGRRIPLYLETHGHSHEMLRGIDDRGTLFEQPYTPQSILNALNHNNLLPSLFTCFLIICLARGVTCAGGYFQGEYLPVMQEGLAKALRNTTAHRCIADYVQGVTSYTYLSGMQGVMSRLEDGALIPAGPAEIIAGGGLTEEDIQKLLSLRVRDAHLASLLETVPDVAPFVLEIPGWKTRLAMDCGCLLADKVVIK